MTAEKRHPRDTPTLGWGVRVEEDGRSLLGRVEAFVRRVPIAAGLVTLADGSRWRCVFSESRGAHWEATGGCS